MTRALALATMGASVGGAAYAQRILALNPTCYWPLWDSQSPALNKGSAGAALNLAFSETGVTYRVPGIGDGCKGVEFDGTNSSILLGTAAFDAIWNGDKGSAIAWGRVDAAARWTDDTTHRWLFHVRSRTDNLYYLVFGKNSSDHQVEWRRRTGGAINSVTHTFNPTGPTTWICIGMTWDQPNIYAYLNGAYIGTNNWVNVAWGTHPVDGVDTVLYAGSTEAQFWLGRGAHAAYWAGTVLSQTIMESLTTL
jgi:hypothetical protein